jgi:hypothetical protein
MSEYLNTYNTGITFILGIIAVITVAAGAFRWKVNQITNSAKFKLITAADIDKLTERIDDLCKRIEDIRKQMEREVVSAKEEHAAMQIKYQELVKELYKLIGQVTAQRDKYDH